MRAQVPRRELLQLVVFINRLTGRRITGLTSSSLSPENSIEAGKHYVVDETKKHSKNVSCTFFYNLKKKLNIV